LGRQAAIRVYLFEHDKAVMKTAQGIRDSLVSSILACALLLVAASIQGVAKSIDSRFGTFE
jgi:hypothetical protein